MNTSATVMGIIGLTIAGASFVVCITLLSVGLDAGAALLGLGLGSAILLTALISGVEE